MSPNNLFFTLLLTAFLSTSCNSGSDNNSGSADSVTTDNTTTQNNAEGTDPKGIGKYQNVELTHPLDEKMVENGKNVYDVKCASCHKLTDERVVGPGWKGVTDRRTPEWIMNFVTNTEEMLAKDTASRNMLEVCLVTMPNQNLQEADARAVLEFMRKNDGKQ
jgi:hypothetical protein